MRKAIGILIAVVGSHTAAAQSTGSGFWAGFGVAVGTANGSCSCINATGSPGLGVLWPGLALGTHTVFSGFAKAGIGTSSALRIGAQVRASVSGASGTIEDVVDLGPTLSYSLSGPSHGGRIVLTVSPGLSFYHGGWDGAPIPVPGPNPNGFWPSDVSLNGVGSSFAVELGYELRVPRSGFRFVPRAAYVYDNVGAVANGWKQSLFELGAEVLHLP